MIATCSCNCKELNKIIHRQQILSLNPNYSLLKTREIAVWSLSLYSFFFSFFFPKGQRLSISIQRCNGQRDEGRGIRRCRVENTYIRHSVAGRSLRIVRESLIRHRSKNWPSTTSSRRDVPKYTGYSHRQSRLNADDVTRSSCIVEGDRKVSPPMKL